MASSVQPAEQNPFHARSRRYATEKIMEKLLGGEEHLVEFPGSQYSQGTSSACGLIALNCVRLLLDLEYGGKREDELVALMCRQGFMKTVMSAGSYWTDTAHLELEEIYKTPFFEAHLNLVSQEYCSAEESMLKILLQNLEREVKGRNPFSQASLRRSRALVITRPPEIIVCFKIAHSIQDIYAIFDSHPRPRHPRSAAFIMGTSLDKAAQYLGQLLKVDQGIFDGNLQWQAQLLGNVSGHIFEHSGRNMRMSEEAERVMLEANIRLLMANAELDSLRADGRKHKEDNERLKKRIVALEDNVRQGARRSVTVPLDKGKRPAVAKPPGTRVGYVDGSMPGEFPLARPTNTYASSSRLDKDISRTLALANRQEASSSKSFSPPVQKSGPSRRINNEDMSSLILAQRMAHEFEQEDAKLRQQVQDLKGWVQATFECCVCMEKVPEDDVAKMDNCKHSFCRDCIRQYIVSRIEEHRYPIICPICSTEKENQNPGMVTSFLVETVGMSEKTYHTFEELQLAQFSVILDCQKCKQGSLVDKDEFQQSKYGICPLPTCRYQWCKNCLQEVTEGGPEHSCDGSAEMKLLIEEKGWKVCPGCQTPTEKISGCNSISCITPGCNTHFCYKCGQTFIRTALWNEVGRAKAEHFKTCALF